ncbi:FecR family protein [Persicitalea jodogahamensis]|uniref:Iron dicitrate transporter FecR n=1 Tax=Persicitalea jodogahamensis TaxID=402147 RepID=A0A8J3D6W1_9BACT|nr:FecR family protein [Persicitalea jodogahamensis]GHB54291.1 iron dicitrate transporter FecR [Persicitalea jodogahamensis]
MSKQHFRTLLKRYQANESTPQERRIVEQWFSLLDGEPPVRTASENQQLEEKMWRAIQQQKSETEQPVVPLSAHSRWWWSAASILLIGMAWFAYDYLSTKSDFLTASNATRSTSTDLISRFNDTAEAMAITLSDGSTVTLSPRSRVEYPAAFESDRREVTLIGEALFNVTRNPNQPFFVNAGELTTKVLGTSFRVEAGEDNRLVQVSVLTGKVSVFQRSASDEQSKDKIKNGVILTPNQRVVYKPASHSFETSLVEQPMVVAPDGDPSARNPEFVTFAFEDATMAAVVSRLERAYGIEIILENEELSKCLFTADITQQPLFTKLDLLCAALNATYEVRGTKILIMGSGCR